MLEAFYDLNDELSLKQKKNQKVRSDFLDLIDSDFNRHVFLYQDNTSAKSF